MTADIPQKSRSGYKKRRKVMTTEWVAILTGSAAAALITGVLTIIKGEIDARRKRTDYNADVVAGLSILLVAWIKSLGREHIDRGYITFDELQDITRMNEIYHTNLGGNGYVAKIMTEVGKLPIKEKKDN